MAKKRKKSPSRGGFREGSGRPAISKGGAVPFSLSLPAEMVDAIDAARGDRSRSEAGREAFGAWLKGRRVSK